MIPNLQNAREAFTHWRTSREKRGSTPSALRQMAVDLLSEYSPSQIALALGINTKALSDWAKETTNTTESTALTFVPLTLSAEPFATMTETQKVQLRVMPDDSFHFEGDVQTLVRVAQLLRGKSV